MALRKVSARAEIKNRSWLEISLDLEGEKVVACRFLAQGPHDLIGELEKLRQLIPGQILKRFEISGDRPSQILIREALEKLQGVYKNAEDVEICHCRKINLSVIDQMIVLGAHTPEKVKAWCTAGSGCGTCRPEVQILIDERIRHTKKAA
jgi:NAD(P)H-nitrite reductase large subunit